MYTSRMLHGLKKSIMVSTSCLKEINQLRAAYRPDLKPYPPPTPPKPDRKRKLTGSVQHDEPTPKKLCGANPGPLNKGKQWLGKDNTALPNKTPTKRKQTESTKPRAEQPAKKARSGSDTDVVFLFQEPDLPYKFHSVDEQWQRTICDFMGLCYRRPNKVTRGGPNVPLGPPDPRAIKPIAGDGNCFFRSISYIITVSELQHMDVRRVVLDPGPEPAIIDWYGH